MIMRPPRYFIKGSRLRAFKRVAEAAQNLENRWIVFHKIPNSKNFKAVVLAENEVCGSLAHYRKVNGMSKIIDWEEIEKAPS